MKHVDTRSAKSKYLEVSELGTRFNLSFSSQLEFGNKIIALDGRKKCLLVLETGTDTITPETLAAFQDHGHPESHLEDDIAGATKIFRTLKVANIDINTVTQKLEDEGIEKFNIAYDDIIGAIKKKQTGQIA